MSRPLPDGSLTTVTTMKDINDLMLSLDCKDYKAEIMTVDTKASHKEGVIVLVTGCLTRKDNVRRKFTKSFFLAPQSNGYYVLSDAFRFIVEDELPTATPVEGKESDEDVTASTVAKEPELVEVVDKSLPNVAAAVEPVSNGSVDVCDKPDEQLIVKEHVVAAEPPVEVVNQIDEQVVVESSSDVQDAPKKPYASIDRKESMRATPVHAPPTTVKKSSTNNGNQTRGTTPSAPKPQANGTAPQPGQQLKEAANSTSAPESSAPNGNTRHGNGIDKAEEKGYSIYIGNLPFDATDEHVEQDFKKFGPIKKGGIQVRCSKVLSFGFVEYESLSSVQKALELYLTYLSTSERILLSAEEYPIRQPALHHDDIWVATTDPSSVHKWPAEGLSPQRGGSFLAPPGRNKEGNPFQDMGSLPLLSSGAYEDLWVEIFKRLPIKRLCKL